MTLAIWTVYGHPTDYPDKYVARLFDVSDQGATPTENIIIAPDLETLQDTLEFELGLVKLTRTLGDDPKIVETWL
jgi:hypothetical protein